MVRRFSGRFARRELLAGAAVVGVGTVLGNEARSQENPARQAGGAWKSAILKYLEGLKKEDGGYGFEGQERGHITPTWAVIGCYQLLGEHVPRAQEVAEFVRTHHPRALKGQLGQEMRQFEWQQIQSLVWLGEDVSSFREVVLGWKEPYAYPKQYERHGYPVFQQEVSAILSWRLVGLPPEEIPVAFINYLNSRRRQNGSFNNTPASDGSDGHVLNTWWGLQALAALETMAQPVVWNKGRTVSWLRRCQNRQGGFAYQPTESGWDDVAYTWAAVRSLALLGTDSNFENYVGRLWNADGGFADHSGWLSNPTATYYALDALAATGLLTTNTIQIPISKPVRSFLPVDLSVFSIQLESHGQGSPWEAVDLADELKIQLWGAKNAKSEWIARAQQLAQQEGADVRFFVANEEHGTWIDVPGMGTYSHMSDIIGPAKVDLGPSLAGNEVHGWAEFISKRIVPSGFSFGLEVIPDRVTTSGGVLGIEGKATVGNSGKLLAAGGRLIWQFGENEPLVRMLIDESLMRGAYAAISTYHFGNPDFTNTSPFLMRYRGQIPFVTLHDAHGAEPWWFADMTEGFRTLFLARQLTWEGWLEALKNNWVVAVRHDTVSRGKTWMHGLPEVIEVVNEQWKEWQWWDNPAIERPLVSIVALTPQDEFEVGRPEKGVAIRVRCAMTNTTQGLPKAPIADFVKLMVAGKRVEPEHVVKRRPNGAVEDDYYLYPWPDIGPGRYTATATVRKVGTREEFRRSIGFGV